MRDTSSRSFDRKPTAQRLGLSLFMASLLLMLASCTALESIDLSTLGFAPTATPTPEIQTVPNQTPDPSDTAEGEAIAPTPEVTDPLTIWIPPEMAGESELLRQIAAFGETAPALEIMTEPKLAQGSGSLASYLTNGREIAPSILPDIALVPADAVADLAANELIYPVNTIIGEDLIADFYPAAQSFSAFDQSLYGLPYAIDNISHILYDPAVITNTVSSDWALFLEDQTEQWVVPGDHPLGGEWLLQLYLENGGTLRSESGSLQLEQDPLEQALTTIQEGLSAGVIAPVSGNVTTLEDAIILLDDPDNSVAIAMIDSSIYLSLLNTNEDAFQALRATSIPGPNGPLAPQVSGWVWVITRPAELVQPEALDLLEQLISPESMGTFTQASGLLPTRRSTLDTWPTGLYTNFVQRELDRAIAQSQDSEGVILDALMTATENLLESPNPAGAIPSIASDAVNSIP